MNARNLHTHKKVRKLQNNLYHSARNGSRRFFALYDKIYRQEVLEEAWEWVKAGKGEGRIDDNTLRNVEIYGVKKLLKEIWIELQKGKYKPGTDKLIYPDINERKKTSFEIPTVKDRIIQSAVKIVIEPIFEANFVNSSNDFCSKRSSKWALDEIRRAFNDTDYCLVEASIKSCFDRMNQKKLMRLVEKSISDRRILELIQQWLRERALYRKDVTISTTEEAKDFMIAPLLVNIYLNVLDGLWKKHGKSYGNLVRDADDIVIICNNNKTAYHALKLLENILKELDLELDPSKTLINQKPVTLENRKASLNKKADQYPYKNNIKQEEQIEQEQQASEERDVQEKLESEEQKPQEEQEQQEEQRIQEEQKNQVGQGVIRSSGCFCGYKYRFGLYASHCSLTNSIENEHFHNFTITLYINAQDGKLDDNYNVEQVVQEWLKPLHGKQLEKTDLFLGRETTVEGIAETFFDPLYDLIDKMGFELVKLSIYENPIRVYSVSNKRLDSTVNEISSIPLECIPIIQLDEDTVSSEIEQEIQPVIQPENILENQPKDQSPDNLENSPNNEMVQSPSNLENSPNNEMVQSPGNLGNASDSETDQSPGNLVNVPDNETVRSSNNRETATDNESEQLQETLPVNNQEDDKKVTPDNIEKNPEESAVNEAAAASETLQKENNPINADTGEADQTKADPLLNNITENSQFNTSATADPVQGSFDTTASENIEGIEKSSNKKKTNIFLRIFLVIVKLLMGFACFTALAAATMYVIKKSGIYPQGSDTFCHLYRADLILKNIQQGNWFPLYDNTWYNGVEIMRYWGPLPLYIIAGVEWLIKSNVLDAYIVFLGVLILIGGCGWLLWGLTYKRTGLSILIGMIWFYLPENMRVVIKEGNLPRGVINALLPFYFYFLWKVMAEKKRKALIPLIVVTALITLCHLGITLMLIASVLIYALIYGKTNHTLKSSVCAIGASLSGVLLAGVWAVPALIGGAASGSSTNQVMKFFFENALISLNPFTRINGDVLSFYFGLSVFIICMLGIIFGTKTVRPGFITAAVLFICTTKSIYALFSKLPFSQFLWMIRFIPIALAAAMASFLLWKQLRKWTVLVLSILLIADCATSFLYIYVPKEQQVKNVQASLNQRAEDLLLTKAKEMTNQRLAVMDLSKYGSFAPYYVSGVGKRVKYTFGAGWEGAKTASNIVNLNASVESGWYVYLFDRALELGNDTVLIPIDNLKNKSNDVNQLISCAELSGYHLAGKNTGSLLFHKDTIKQFGIITKYTNIAIGTSASCIAMIFPSFEEGSKNNINDYTYEELRKYHTIYLSGFTYDDKSAAEDLLYKLAKNGVQIYIDMNRIPVVKAKKSMELFGVSAQDISFADTYPKLLYKGQAYKSLDFTYDLGEWNTVYMDGLDHIQGKFNLASKDLAFIGTAKNKNLHFVGLNIVYYLQETRDAEIEKLVKAVFGIDENDLPQRTMVPLQIQTSNNKITINSNYDNVNTTLSNIDIFHSKNNYRTINNLITVNSGSTVINLSYPHVVKGMIATAFGLILAILNFIAMRKKKESDINGKIQGN